jgi:hypothetical protein
MPKDPTELAAVLPLNDIRTYFSKDLLHHVLSIGILQPPPPGHPKDNLLVDSQKLSPCSCIRRVFDPENEAVAGVSETRAYSSPMKNHQRFPEFLHRNLQFRENAGRKGAGQP